MKCCPLLSGSFFLAVAASIVTLALASRAPIPSAESQERKDPATPEKAAPGQAATPTGPQELSPLEKKFQETLSGATLSGRWRLVEGGKLGNESEEKYTIGSVIKHEKDVWVIGARIQYGGKDVTLPVPVKVYFAGDTPVISVTNAGLPGLGTYTARVMVHGGYYAGTWSGPGHAGFLSGVLVQEKK